MSNTSKLMLTLPVAAGISIIIIVDQDYVTEKFLYINLDRPYFSLVMLSLSVVELLVVLWVVIVC